MQDPVWWVPLGILWRDVVGTKKRTGEHMNNLQHYRTTNGMVVHAEEHNYLPDWYGSEIFHSGLEKRTSKMVEAAYISTERTTNHRAEFLKLFHATARLVIATMGRT